jgi:hypothetical protein
MDKAVRTKLMALYQAEQELDRIEQEFRANIERLRLDIVRQFANLDVDLDEALKLYESFVAATLNEVKGGGAVVEVQPPDRHP